MGEFAVHSLAADELDVDGWGGVGGDELCIDLGSMVRVWSMGGGQEDLEMGRSEGMEMLVMKDLVGGASLLRDARGMSLGGV